MSSACSATIFFRRAFFFSRARSCLAISGAMPPILLTPPVIRLLGNLKLLADFRDLLALAQGNVRKTELLDDLLCRVPCSLLRSRILSGFRPDAILSQQAA